MFPKSSKSSKSFLIIAFVVVTASVLCDCSTESLARPIVLVYGGGDNEFAAMFAELIDGDERVDADILVVASPEAVRLASAMPNVACIVIYADHRDDLMYLPPILPAFFEAGGGLVGMTEVCNEPSAMELATEIFPIRGNYTLKPPPGTKRAFTYVLDQDMDMDMEIADGLPEAFDVLSIGTYASVDSEGNPVGIPGKHQVVYRDSRTGVPLVLAHQSEMGGRAVAMPGIMVVKNQRVDVYYGNLFINENFTRLLTNSIVWAMGNSRFTRLEQDLDEKINEFNSIQENQRVRSDEIKRERRARRTYFLIAFWAAGLTVCGIILIKLVRIRA